MTRHRIIMAALLAVVSVPAGASVIVVGNNSARLCYESAESPVLPTAEDFRRCDMALREEALVRDDIVATYVNRGILKLRRGQIEAAIVDFDRAIEMDPNQPEAYLNKGAALIRAENPGGALPLFTASLERNTARPEIAHYGRAIANESLGNARAAYDDYRRASELRPEWDEPLVELRRFRIVERR